MSDNDSFQKKFNNYKDEDVIKRAQDWFEENRHKLEELLNNQKLSFYIFEPFTSIIDFKQSLLPKDIYKAITLVAIINSVLAGLPGKMGLGVFVSIGLEMWMALKIAQFVGLTKIKNSDDIVNFFISIASASIVSIWIFKELLGFAFSLFSIIPGVNPLIFAEFFVTNFIGILFYIGFSQLKNSGEFKSQYLNAANLTRELFKHQWSVLKNIFNLENLKKVGTRIWDYLNGNLPIDQKFLNGEIFATVGMAYLLSGEYEKLEGPLGETFIKAIRLRWSSQFSDDSSLLEIADRFREYDAEQIPGVINNIKGKMFELMVEEAENLDGDTWKAELHSNESFPGSDIVLTDLNSGKTIEISLKAAALENTNIIENALVKYPNIPIMTTNEISQLYKDNPQVFGSGISHKELHNITEQNFDELINKIEPINEYKVVFGGVVFSSISILYPFVIAFIKKRINEQQLRKLFIRVMGDSGAKLASRLSYAIVFGPIFAWWLLARGISSMVELATPQTILRISYKKNK